MSAPVFRSSSNSGHNLAFAHHVVSRGLSWSSWIVEHDASQASFAWGAAACALISLRFCAYVLRALAHSNNLTSLLGEVVGHKFFQDVFEICGLAGEGEMRSIADIMSPESALFPSITSLFHVPPMRFTNTRGQIADYVAALEETNLPCGMTLAVRWDGHVCACVYLPPSDASRPVPLFLVFDSLRKYGCQGASVVVHTTRSAAAAHMATAYAGHDGESADITASFFVPNYEHQPRAHARAALVLHVRFGLERLECDRNHVEGNIPLRENSKPKIVLQPPTPPLSTWSPRSCVVAC
ncbi:hypothetical protein FB45DRAFT_1060217 [Roridomyces roridus]|uniref:Uncharacterized protein n=1 Tax=Roridomyces roridus TaxID=1738132 RepID=A0AAD7BME3_9AGAR|nr:hypothetical protein FB45DRAFT_1060217 [Roridomyces roridus]